MQGMAIVFDCPACGERLEVDAAEAGNRTSCGHCQAALLAPAAPKLLRDPAAQRAVAAAFRPDAQAGIEAAGETTPSTEPRRLEKGWGTVLVALRLIHAGDVIALAAFAVGVGLHIIERAARTTAQVQSVEIDLPVELMVILTTWLPLIGIAVGAGGILLAIFGPLPRNGVILAAAGLAARLLLALVVIAPAVGWSTEGMQALHPDHLAWLLAAALTLRVLRSIGQRFDKESLIRRTSGFVLFIILPMAVLYAILPVLDAGLIAGLPRTLRVGVIGVLGLFWIALALAYFFALRQATQAIGNQIRRAQ